MLSPPAAWVTSARTGLLAVASMVHPHRPAAAVTNQSYKSLSVPARHNPSQGVLPVS